MGDVVFYSKDGAVVHVCRFDDRGRAFIASVQYSIRLFLPFDGTIIWLACSQSEYRLLVLLAHSVVIRGTDRLSFSVACL